MIYARCVAYIRRRMIISSFDAPSAMHVLQRSSHGLVLISNPFTEWTLGIGIFPKPHRKYCRPSMLAPYTIFGNVEMRRSGLFSCVLLSMYFYDKTWSWTTLLYTEHSGLSRAVHLIKPLFGDSFVLGFDRLFLLVSLAADYLVSWVCFRMLNWCWVTGTWLLRGFVLAVSWVCCCCYPTDICLLRLLSSCFWLIEYNAECKTLPSSCGELFCLLLSCLACCWSVLLLSYGSVAFLRVCCSVLLCCLRGCCFLCCVDHAGPDASIEWSCHYKY